MDKVEQTKPRLIEISLAAINSFEKCRAEKRFETCEQTLNSFKEVVSEAAQCQNPEATKFFYDKKQKWEYDCASIQSAAQTYVDGLPQLIRHLRLKQELAQAKFKEKRHAPNNKRPLQTPIKVDSHLTQNTKFTPPLNGEHYIRTDVFNTFDSIMNQWFSAPPHLKPYHLHIEATHHYKGFASPRNWSLLYYDKNDLLVLPIPDGFTLDSVSVRLNGEKEGFDLVQDENGLVSLHLRKAISHRHRVEFGMSWEQENFLTHIPEETKGDILPSLPIPEHLDVFLTHHQLDGTQEKFEAVERFVSTELQYPTTKDVLSGRADYPEKTGLEFYRAVAARKLADCDLANSYGVVLLRKLGVPARLVLGYLSDSRGLGRHGWLEYFDDHLGEWVRGDMTPPLVPSPKAIEPLAQGTSGGVTPPSFELEKEEQTNQLLEAKKEEKNGEEWRDVRKGNFRFRIEKEEETLGPKNREKSWAFRGEDFQFSSPTGRYILAKGKRSNTFDAYDLERENFFTIPIPKEAQGCEIENVEEIAGGMLVQNTCRDESIGISGAKPFSDYNLFFNQNGEVIRRDWMYNSIRSKFPPYIRNIKIENKETNYYFLQESVEDSQGRLHLLISYSKPHRYYKVVLSPNEKSEEIVLKPADLGTPFLELDDGGKFHPLPLFQFSEDGAYLALLLPPSFKHSQAEIRIFKEKEELYRYSFEPLPDIDIFRPSSYYILQNKPEFRLNEDGSVDIKQVNKTEALTTHITSQGIEDPIRRHRWIMEKTGRTTVNGEEWALRYQSSAEKKEVALFYAYETDPSGGEIHDIAFDGSRILVKWGSGNWNYFDHNEKYKPPMRTSGTYFSKYSIDSCFNSEDRIRCWVDSLPGWIADPSYPGRNIFSIETELSGAELPLSETLDGTLEKREQFAIWNGSVTIPSGWKETVVFADFAVVNRAEDPNAHDFKETLKRNPFSSSEARASLANIAQDSKIYLHHEWLLLGAAELFDLFASCQNSIDLPHCTREVEQTNDFLKIHGPLLAQRFQSHLKESSYFPNEAVVEKSWAYFLAGAEQPKMLNLLRQMIASDSKKAAEAIFLSVEMGLIKPKNIPSLSGVEEALLELHLSHALSRRRSLAFNQSKQSRLLLFGQVPLWRYLALENSLVARFGETIRPPELEKGW